MNYLTEMKAFYDFVGSNPLPASAIALWHALMSIANGVNWPNEITPTLSTLQSRSGLGKDAICGARNKLAQCGLIEWRSRGGKQSASYRLLSLVSVKPTQHTPQEATQHTPQEATQHTPQEATQHTPQEAAIYILNETKLNETKKNSNVRKRTPTPRFQKPTIEQVREYCLERSNSVDSEKFIDHYTANGWHVGRNPMKDWKAAVRQWEKNNYATNTRYSGEHAAGSNIGTGRQSGTGKAPEIKHDFTQLPEGAKRYLSKMQGDGDAGV